MPDYTIDALAKGLTVLKALEGTRFEPVTLTRISDRTKLDQNYCFRALQTLAAQDFATKTSDGKWMLGKSILKLSDRLNEAVQEAT
jgi:DNA-binding IclR family transcriptional regulator